MPKKDYKLTPDEREIIGLSSEDGNIFTRYWFNGYEFDYKIDPPWQLALHHAAEEQATIVGGTGCGKAQPLDAPVLTPAGWAKIGDLRIGDSVIGSAGKAVKVIGIFPQGVKEIYRVHFSDDTWAESCDEHLWTVTTKKSRSRHPGKWKTIPLSVIRERLSSVGCNHDSFYIPLVEPVEFQDASQLPLDPYLLGILIGDGNFRPKGVRFASADPAIVSELSRLLPNGVKVKYTGRYDYELPKTEGKYNPLITRLRALGLMGKHAWEKGIPGVYLRASIRDRVSLLQGLMDTDGSVAPNGVRAEYCTTSKVLAEQVCELVRSLGGIARLSSKNTSYTYRGEKRSGRTAYRVFLRIDVGIQLFRLSRKAERVGERTKYPVSKTITRVEEIGQKEAVCIKVDSGDGLYVTKDYIVTHNTGAVAMSAAVWAATTFGFKFMNLAPTLKQSKLSFEYIMDHARRTPFEKLIYHYSSKIDDTKIILRHDLIGESVLMFQTAANISNNQLGFEVDWINIDEYGLIKDLSETLIRLTTRMRGTVRVGEQERERLCRLTLLSNPHEDPEMYYIYDMAETDPNVLSMTLSARSNKNISAKQLKAILRNIPEDQQDRWIEGKRPEGGSDEYPGKLIANCEDEGLDAIMEAGLQREDPGFLWKRYDRADVVLWALPYDPDRLYIIVMDPGQGKPPYRNAPVITVWDVTNFPGKRAELRAFWWEDGRGTYRTCINQFKHWTDVYHAQWSVFDSTGTQQGFADMFNLQEQAGMMAYGWNLAGQVKNQSLLAQKMFMAKGLLGWPKKIRGIRSQHGHYTLPDTNLAQDIVANFQITSGFLRRFYYIPVQQEEEPEPVAGPTDRFDRAESDRYGRDPGIRES